MDNEQHQKFKDGQTVYVSGLVDKKGKEYNGYITFNKETNKTDFSFQNPNKLKEQAKPTEAYKTQTAVNSDGKTNEAKKNIKEPLKSGQKKPSVAREIASLLGATEKKDGYLMGNGYFVTWAFGHLIGLGMPEDYGAITITF